MPDYSKGKIYTIRCRTDDSLIYVGSTIQSLAVRWGGHKTTSKTEKNKKNLLYRTVNDNWNDWFIELYEVYPCENIEQLNKREGEVIRLIGTLNSKIAGRTKKIYYEDNKDDILIRNKEYYEDNKDDILIRCKEYYEDNKDDIAIKHKKYREDNKDKINEKITCECGCISTKIHLSRHKKSQRHLNAINTS
jgi:hypothetical protein